MSTEHPKKAPPTKLLIGIIIVLAIAAFWFFMQKWHLETELIYQKSIPHVSLSNTQLIQQNGRFYADITGFVAFKNEADQPKGMRQYVSIEPSFIPEMYELTEIIVIHPLPPSEFDRVLLSIAQETPSMLVLTDDDGNTWSINKITKEVQMLDVTGDAAYLITDNNEYQDFMREFLSK